ncbi:unnamed protein product [Lampetra planeri]
MPLLLLPLLLPQLRSLGHRRLLGGCVQRKLSAASAAEATNDSGKKRKGLVLGVYEAGEGDAAGPLCLFTPAGEAFSSRVPGGLTQLIHRSGPALKKGKSRIFHGLHEFSSVVIVGLGKKSAPINKLEQWDEQKEAIRAAAAAGCRQLQELEVAEVEVDPCGDAQAAAEGSVLALFQYDEFKKKKKTRVAAKLHGREGAAAWATGVVYAEGQNLARRLMEAPANHMTPAIFGRVIQEQLSSLSTVEVHARPRAWIEEQQMGAFLSVTRGSEEPPLFLELHYHGASAGGGGAPSPVVYVGKGVTFDSGGISLKPSSGMDAMRADMGGAATVCSAIATAAKLQLPIHIIGLVPLCENMPSGKATKPGDVVVAKNGKTIQVDNTDAEGRLILADALCYADTFQPRAVLDAATLTGAMSVALGSAATGVFTNSDWLWAHLMEASVQTGDRVWRMPLFQHYTKQIADSQLADINNVGKYSRAGGACTAAAFLREFVTAKHWAHLDIAGVMDNKDEVPYLSKGMAGRPTRTLVELAARLAHHTSN